MLFCNFFGYLVNLRLRNKLNLRKLNPNVSDTASDIVGVMCGQLCTFFTDANTF